MKKFLFYGVLFFSVGCTFDAQKKTHLKADLDSVSNIVNITVQKISPADLTRVLIDSSNNYKEKEDLPAFFYNYMLDYENPWLTDHRDFSVRKLVFDSTKNIHLLKAILESADARLRRTVDASNVDDSQLLNSLPFRGIPPSNPLHLR